MDQHEGTQRNPVNPLAGSEHITSNPPPPAPHLDQAIQAGPGILAPGDEPPLTIRQWFAQNAFTLIVLAGLAYLIVSRFDLEGILAIGKAALGLSFVIFIHELGHFLVAKWCDVHVTVFSIGFGPALPGCSYKWGETTYKLALFPLGGYVQMVGQVDGDESSDASEEDDPRSYRNKSVPQRMAIISAGVIMNVILAVICFIVVFQGPGKDRPAAVVSYVDTGAPAFKEGLRTGDQFEQVGDIRNPHFEDLMRVVMASSHGEEVYIEARGPNHFLKADIVPRKDDTDVKPVIGIMPSERLELVLRKFLDPSEKSPAWSYTAAANAEPPFAFGDRIIAMTDPVTKKVTDLPDDPRFPGHGQRDYFEFVRRMQLLAGKEVVMRVERKKDDAVQTVDITVPPAFHYTLGVRMHMGPIAAVRKGSPAAAAGIIVRDKDKKVPGDLIENVSYKDKDGKTVTLVGEKQVIDPLRLPDELRKALAEIEGPKKVTLHLRRLRSEPGEQNQTVKVELDWQADWSVDRAVPMGPSSPWAIPELGLAYLVKSTVAESTNKDNPLQAWDDIKEIQIVYRTAKEDNEKSAWLKLDSDEEWAYAYFSNFVNFAGPPTIKTVKLKVERNKEIKEIELTPELDETWPLTERGLIFMRDLRRQKADNFYGAVALGLKDTHNSMIQVFQTIRGMILSRLSPKSLGGPITIARVAYKFAGIDIWEFIFFLGLISVNLAVINFLPIPVLDGGHMVFLLYELVRGKPASEGVRAGATYAGLALILCLMIFVFYLDITRLFL